MSFYFLSRLIIPNSSLWSMDAIYISYDTSLKNNAKHKSDVEDFIKPVCNLKTSIKPDQNFLST